MRMGERRIGELFAAAGAMGFSACRFSSVVSFALVCTGCGAGYQNAPADGGNADGGASADGGESDAIAATDGAVTVDVVDGNGAAVDAGADGVLSDGGPILGDAAEAGCEPVDGSTYNCGVNEV